LAVRATHEAFTVATLPAGLGEAAALAAGLALAAAEPAGFALAAAEPAGFALAGALAAADGLAAALDGAAEAGELAGAAAWPQPARTIVVQANELLTKVRRDIFMRAIIPLASERGTSNAAKTNSPRLLKGGGCSRA
jgi:hypothetical protein